MTLSTSPSSPSLENIKNYVCSFDNGLGEKCFNKIAEEGSDIFQFKKSFQKGYDVIFCLKKEKGFLGEQINFLLEQVDSEKREKIVKCIEESIDEKFKNIKSLIEENGSTNIEIGLSAMGAGLGALLTAFNESLIDREDNYNQSLENITAKYDKFLSKNIN
jgi:hypothetical protein